MNGQRPHPEVAFPAEPCCTNVAQADTWAVLVVVGGVIAQAEWVVQNRQHVFFCSGEPYILVSGGKCHSPDLFVRAPSNVH